MTIATIDRHTYARQDTPMVNATHYKILGKYRFHCIQPNCDGAHHWWCSCGH